MEIYMYDKVPNFGDVLNKYIWPHYLGALVERKDDIVMFGIGTVLGQQLAHRGRYVVCGSGCGYGTDIESINTGAWTFFFVRGPLTAKTLGLPETMAITDPAILTPDIFKPATPSGRTVFVPHWETAYNPLWRKACAQAGIDYVDPLAPVAQVCAAISGARLVITEAMHGAILADSYRVPWVPVATSVRVNRFKWMDWLLSMDIDPDFRMLTALGWSDRFRSLGLYSNGANRNKAPLGASKMSPTHLKSALAKHLSPDLKDRIKSELFLRVGPYIDRVCYELPGTHGENHVARSAVELSDLAKLSGWLSAEKIYQSRSQTVREKISEINERLLSQAVT